MDQANYKFGRQVHRIRIGEIKHKNFFEMEDNNIKIDSNRYSIWLVRLALV